jgi:hypothetical protein
MMFSAMTWLDNLCPQGQRKPGLVLGGQRVTALFRNYIRWLSRATELILVRRTLFLSFLACQDDRLELYGTHIYRFTPIKRRCQCPEHQEYGYGARIRRIARIHPALSSLDRMSPSLSGSHRATHHDIVLQRGKECWSWRAAVCGCSLLGVRLGLFLEDLFGEPLWAGRG